MEEASNEINELNVPNWTSLLEKARQLHRIGDIAAAEAICRQILSDRPEQADALHLLGIIAHQEGNSHKAVGILRQAIGSMPSDLNIYKNLILMLKEMDLMDDAAAYCKIALSATSNHYQTYHGLGDMFFQDGYFEEAISCYERVLSIKPDSGTVWGNLGNALQACDRYDEAIECYRNALPLDPTNAEIYYNMGIAFGKTKCLDKAISNFEKALVLNPGHAQALFNMGKVFKSRGRLDKAIACYQQCTNIDAEDIDARHNLANALYADGQLDAAMEAYAETLRRQPGHILALNNFGCLLTDLQARHQAVSMFQRSIEIDPNYAPAYVNLGNVHREGNEFEHAMKAYQQALALAPENHDALVSLGRLLKITGRYDEGLELLKRAVASSPDVCNAWWYYHLALPILYDTEVEIATHRKRFSDGMTKLIDSVHLDRPEQYRKALDGIGSLTNFYLQYQGQNDLDLQKQYGDFVHRVMAANFPEWVKPRSMPPIKQNGKIKIGYLSSFMRAHTVGHFLMGWLENHDTTHFEIHSYHIGQSTDSLTQEFKVKSDRYYHIAGNIEAMAQQILDDDLHILIFTDIGMFAPATQLAGLRLAPIQCKGWGHPVTTGSPTIDYYLSSDLMESFDAAAHYSEQLVLLPNLALALKPPQIFENGKTRNEFGLSDDDFVFLTSQSLFKYLPQYDDIYPLIASKVIHSKFVFISHSNPTITAQFRKRLKGAFHRHNLPMERFCVFQPRLSPDEFMHLNQASDVLLDPFSWSGGKTTLEGISCGLPVVTCPGAFMRSRHAYAMLKMMGISDTIAPDLSSYVEIACRLANDKKFYDRMRKETVAKRHRLFNDVTCVRGLEAFYQCVVKAQLPVQEIAPHG